MEFKTSYGSVRNVNKKKKNKMKLIKNGILGIGGAVIVLVGGLHIYKQINKNQINDVPEGQITTTISIQVEEGDTLSEIADRFYTDACDDVYRYLSNYQDAIQKENNIIGRDPKLRAGTTIEVPVVVHENNAYYQRILELEDQIANIEENNKWVRHTVKQGDLFSTLAEQASIDISETYELAKEIANKNNMSTKDILNVGQEIWIINPELGKLKVELKQTQEMFIQYLSGKQIKK